jgi:tetratricopeptide (TPR) repeat protein
MNVLAVWSKQLDTSLSEFAQIAAAVEGIDFTYGLLATAVLWPVRATIQAYDSDMIAALRQICGSQAKEIIHAVQGWPDDPTQSARLLAGQAQASEELRLALTDLISYFDAAQPFAGHLAQLLVKRHGGGDVYEIREQIKAALVNIGGVTSIQSLSITINLETNPRRLWLILAAVVVPIVTAVIVGAVIFAPDLPPPQPTPTLAPMPNGFNIAVAEFSVAEEVTTPEVGLEFSQWLLDFIERETGQLPEGLRVATRGPSLVGVVPGADPEKRIENARAIADKHGATILVYGTVFLDDGGLQVQPEFYVRDEGFGYGSEAAGPGQLGYPVTIDMTLDGEDRFNLNRTLNGRTQALQYLVSGLAKFFIRRYDEAAADFERAAAEEAWDSGREVAYLLVGAAHLRRYDQITNPGELAAAKENFLSAYGLNDEYGRAYLGLGAAARAEAAILCEDGTAICDADPAKLIEARDWYFGSLQTADQPTTAHIPVKAAYGLGQTHLLGFQHGIPGWSAQRAYDYFQAVIAAYEAEPTPELAWFAAHAHALSGFLAASRQQPDYETMAAEYEKAIDLLLNELPAVAPRPRNWLARFSAQIGLAKAMAGFPDEAHRAYCQAIDYGEDSVSESEIAKWRDALNAFGGDCDEE